MGLFPSQYQHFKDSWKCIEKALKNSSVPVEKDCSNHLTEFCPTRFGLDSEKSEHCRRQIHEVPPEEKDQKIKDYLDCEKTLRKTISPCIDMLQEKCLQAKVVVVKSVRLDMVTAGRLLAQDNTMSVVHYLRDPRPVSLSRMGHPSFRGLYSLRPNITRNAFTYCQDVATDIKIREILQKFYPQRIMQLFYEEFAIFPHLTSERIYQFLSLEMPDSLSEWLTINTNTKQEGAHKKWTTRKSSDILTKWHKKISRNTVLEINNICQSLFNIIKMPWPGSTL